MIGRPVMCAIDSGRPASSVAVELGQHDRVVPDPHRGRPCAVETASWPIIESTTNKIFVGIDRVPDRGRLRHQLGIDAQPAGPCR